MKNSKSSNSKQFLVIIPVFNEAENLPAVVDELQRDLPDFDILVVNDGSTDETAALLKTMDYIHTLSLPFNVGYSLALKTGFKYANQNHYDYIIQFDGDGQHIASEALKLTEHVLATKADIVIGSRFMEASDYPHSPIRRLGTGIFKSLIRFFCRQSIHDPTSGFQVLSRRVVQLYADMPYFPQFPDANLIVDMILSGYEVTEIPVKMRQRLSGKGMHENIYSSFYYMMLILYNILIILVKHLFKTKGESR
ncbi:MAG: glycosyltransferase family 2 protein [Candidatus Marinimicrobia bacterium]|nr:glycosyltransferase family 2 protein [Candidatus Neomarinimicrobiota bacterium]